MPEFAGGLLNMLLLLFNGPAASGCAFSNGFSNGFDICDAGVTVTPPTAILGATGFAPTVSTPVTVTPPTAVLGATGLVPTVTAGSSVTVTPGVKVLGATGFAPTVTTCTPRSASADTIQVRRGTSDCWTSVNPVLSAGEPGFETDTGLLKIGDGSTAWSSLRYEASRLPAGTTTRAPIKFIDGTLLTTPEQGAFEFASTTLYFTPEADRRSVNLSDGIITADTTVSNTIAETTVYTEPISANELHVGQIVKTRVLGVFSTASGVPTFTARLKVGGTTVDTVTSVGKNVTNGGFDVEFVFTIRTLGATGTAQGHVLAVFDNDSFSDTNTTPTTIDTTAADDITLTIQWSAANASNSVTIKQGWCEFIN